VKPFKTRLKPILKNVVASKYDKITLKILKEKPIKSIRIKSDLNILITYPWGTKKLRKIKSFQFRTFENKVNFDPSKVHNYHLIKVSQEKIKILKNHI